MNALVVYESLFGNTESIATAIAEGLGSSVPVEICVAHKAPERIPGDIDLLVVGGPTHAFGMSRPATRRSAGDEATRLGWPTPGQGVIGIREWIEELVVPPGLRTVTFDTRVSRSFVPGSAARAARRRLTRIGCDVTQTRSFYVEGTPGPLRAGERTRARTWGRSLVQEPTQEPTQQPT